LKFRTSYGQNVLKHSIETAHIARMLAEELGADVNIVKKAALLHDVGKAVDHDIGGSHRNIEAANVHFISEIGATGLKMTLADTIMLVRMAKPM